MKILKFIVIFLFIIIIMAVFYIFRNINYDYSGDKFLKNKSSKLGLEEKQFRLDDGSVINYAEGPDNGPDIVLLHGQMVDWKDYRAVLPKLTKEFHVFALDYYGHGKSSKNPDLYNIERISSDIALFIKEKVGLSTIISGHSSGALITAYIAAEFPENLKAIILEDGPFFATEKGRAESTFSYKTFQSIHNYLTEKPNVTYFEYYLKNNPMRILFNKNGNDNWHKIVAEPAMKLFRKDMTKIPVIWYYPPELGVNTLLQLSANLQDRTGDFDLRFGNTFYDFSFFNDTNQEEILKRISIPTCIFHVNPPKETAPSYYTAEGMLISAMDEKDAQRINELIPESILVEGFDSTHNIHVDQPKEYINKIVEFLDMIDKKNK
ncbi:alpha/beta hydrolase [Peptostreptococcus canis]|uniref:Alpha/beta hydrolase n=1 Tax=Peptostreptococcus canis TaxID=1159213 RepID=A0ABR6TJ37_9FIRM|nr:alpha/beta hydrolase [Peptostreptococcus canis]MBC2575431.1 alpha/beta hydrolase [Peptostreptococcus canis]MBP1997378.1 pimeloyl-ACP methyl ester carboxylesterase [Peptostreptococcus canis]